MCIRVYKLKVGMYIHLIMCVNLTWSCDILTLVVGESNDGSQHREAVLHYYYLLMILLFFPPT